MIVQIVTNTDKPKPKKVFHSLAHDNGALRERLELPLKELCRQECTLDSNASKIMAGLPLADTICLVLATNGLTTIDHAASQVHHRHISIFDRVGRMMLPRLFSAARSHDAARRIEADASRVYELGDRMIYRGTLGSASWPRHWLEIET